MKKVLEVRQTDDHHWVGDGFPVQTMFSYLEPAERLSPFLLLDYAQPYAFTPSETPRGVGKHPHRGFETVTIVFQGEVEHGDSAGNHGKIGPGDVQWMTAASGVVHEEFHSHAFTHRGGNFEVAQLWVNLPAKDKMSAPGYQPILDAQIPRVELPGGAGSVRIIAGAMGTTRGPAKTFTPINVWDARFKSGTRAELPVPDGHNTLLVLLSGAARVADKDVEPASLVVFDRAGDRIGLECTADATALVLTGQPIDEPVVGHGPFVMNTAGEIRQALSDYASGRFAS